MKPHNQNNKDCPRNMFPPEFNMYSEQYQKTDCTCPPSAVDRVEEIRERHDEGYTVSCAGMSHQDATVLSLTLTELNSHVAILLTELDAARAEIAELRKLPVKVQTENIKLRATMEDFRQGYVEYGCENAKLRAERDTMRELIAEANIPEPCSKDNHCIPWCRICELQNKVARAALRGDSNGN